MLQSFLVMNTTDQEMLMNRAKEDALLRHFLPSSIISFMTRISVAGWQLGQAPRQGRAGWQPCAGD